MEFIRYSRLRKGKDGFYHHRIPPRFSVVASDRLAYLEDLMEKFGCKTVTDFDRFICKLQTEHFRILEHAPHLEVR